MMGCYRLFQRRLSDTEQYSAAARLLLLGAHHNMCANNVPIGMTSGRIDGISWLIMLSVRVYLVCAFVWFPIFAPR